MAPAQRPHRSKQDYRTPDNFIDAVKKRLGIDKFTIDLAATYDNAQAGLYISDYDNAGVLRWRGWGWLNPPYTNIGQWAQRCAEVRQWGGNIALLVPASVGSDWFAEFVHPHARVLALNGRLAFMPDKPKWLYPKDCLLALYSQHYEPGFEVWNWRKQ